MLSVEDLSVISPRTLLLVIAGDRDTLSADDASQAFSQHHSDTVSK